MNIVFCIKKLADAAGGAERVLVDVANGLASRGHQVQVLSFDEQGQLPFYEFSELVSFTPLGVSGGGPFSFVIRHLKMKKFASDLNSDVIFGFLPSIYIILSYLFWLTPQKFIACEHITRAWYKRRQMRYVAVVIAALLSSKISFLSVGIAREYLGIPKGRKIILPNPVRAFNKQAKVMGKGKQSYTILNVGRLVEFKDQAILIRAFAKLVAEFPKWRLKIIGKGALKPDLEALIKHLDLNDVVKMIDFSGDIEGDYASADLFVIPSRYEGFGLVTAEASSCGLPCVGFSDAPGTNSIIRHGENGILIIHSGDKLEALTSALRRLMDNPKEMQRLGKNGLSRPSWFELEAVLDHWEETISSCIGKNRD